MVFTGIVEETGTVRTLAERDGGVALEVAAHVVCDDLKLGDSVAVNGVCLTVTAHDAAGFTVGLPRPSDGPTLAISSPAHA